MLARKTTPISEGGARRPPRCRTCGEQMRGHKKALCQLRSPFEEPGQSTLGSIFKDTSSAAASLPSTPPLTPTPSSRNTLLGRVSFYPIKPISLNPSWEAPPDGTFYHRRNPYIDNPLALSEVARNTPLRRTASWISTEKAESEIGERVDDDDDDDDCSTLQSVPSNTPRSRLPATRATSTSTSTSLPTPPTTPPNSQNKRHTNRQVEVIDAAGNKLTGLDLSTLNENIKSVIRQADLAGYYATIVRPRIGHSRDIRTAEDADKHTTVFVSAGPDTMSFNNNHPASAAFQRNAEVSAGAGAYVNTKSWLSVFFTMFFASLIAFWASLFLIRTFW